MKKFLDSYLLFSKKDRIGIIALFLLIIIIYLLPRFFIRNQSHFAAIDSIIIRNRDTETVFQKKPASIKSPFSHGSIPYVNGELFTFNPNDLSEEGWEKLGLASRIIKIIVHYRSKGGKFKKPEDLKKIWGMPEGFYTRIEHYIDIPKEEHYKEEHYNKTNFFYPEKKLTKSLDLDVNLADTSGFIALPGIGPTLAARIIKYRDKLGGFYKIDQVSEVYGIQDSLFRKLKPYFHLGIAMLKKVNINSSTKDELKAHPYIRWNLANAIVEYRNQHGPYLQISDIKNISLINDTVFARIAPYLILQ